MKIRTKLFRWRDEQWKERGIGNAKLMRDREQKQVRFIMRQEKTLKPVANFIGMSYNDSFKILGFFFWLKISLDLPCLLIKC